MPPKDRFSTTTRLRLLGEQAVVRASERVYRARPVRRSRLTGRAALLALVLCALIVALAYPMRQYVSQRAEIADQRTEKERSAARVERLRDEKARWQDEEYLRRQARERLHYVTPGETSYTVRDGSADAERDRDGDGAADRPWYDNLLDGVDTADR
ncbi:septum formation initiator family protein [Streptomyces polyrhachis]|uniref:Septum formation initiator family protein n=1 Tax=Streptomyces polyrhachis TaxID=1282885 RepID=A0ABW2GJ14_9ACTN